jgi:hypothetical protein
MKKKTQKYENNNKRAVDQLSRIIFNQILNEYSNKHKDIEYEKRK